MNNEYTPEQWAKWASYKSNKDRWIEQEEREKEEIVHKSKVKKPSALGKKKRKDEAKKRSPSSK